MAFTKTNNRFVKNTKNYLKQFESFSDGYSELIKIVPEIKAYGGDNPIYDVVIGNMLDTIKDNVPSPQNPNFPNTLSISVSSREVGFRTDDSLAFGWRIMFNRSAGKTIYQFRVTFITLSINKQEYVKALTDNEWKESELHKQSRFWNKTEGKRPNTKRFNKQEESAPASDDELNKLKETLDSEVHEDEQESTEVEEVKEAKPESSISKGAVDTVFIVHHNGRNIVVNIASEDVPVGVTVNNQDKTITLDDGTAFNYESLEKISE